jgi:DNA-directed RNA polymerase subunit M/transcription elongation factor TFIIS
MARKPTFQKQNFQSPQQQPLQAVRQEDSIETIPTTNTLTAPSVNYETPQEDHRIKMEMIEQEEEFPVKPPEILMEEMLNDRMLRYKQGKPARLECPKCNHFPVVTCQRRKDIQGKIIYAQYRCRNCGHRWEEKGR